MCQIRGNFSRKSEIILLRNVCGTPLKLGQQVNRVYSQLLTAGPAATLPSTLPGFPVPAVPYRRLPVATVSCYPLGRFPKTMLSFSLILPAVCTLLPIIHCCQLADCFAAGLKWCRTKSRAAGQICCRILADFVQNEPKRG